MVMPHIGMPELIIVLVVILIIFGAGKLPQVGGAIGKGMREFRRGTKGEISDEDEGGEQQPATKKGTARKKGGSD